jgi:hypothetical protein
MSAKIAAAVLLLLGVSVLDGMRARRSSAAIGIGRDP